MQPLLPGVQKSVRITDERVQPVPDEGTWFQKNRGSLIQK